MSGSSLHRIASGGDVNIKAGSAHLDKTNTGYIQTNLNEKVGGSIALSAGDSYGKTKDDKGGDMSMTAGNAHGGDGGSILIKSGRSDRASGKCWFVVCDDCLHLCHEFYNMSFLYLSHSKVVKLISSLRTSRLVQVVVFPFQPEAYTTIR